MNSYVEAVHHYEKIIYIGYCLNYNMFYNISTTFLPEIKES